MATLKFNGESYNVDHAVKGTDYVHGYDANGNIVVAIDGISNFSVVTYNDMYLKPEECTEESCNEVIHVNGKMRRRDGTEVPASAVNALPATESTSSAGCFMRMPAGIYEWVNPPMHVGNVFRTMERYSNKPVFTQIVHFGEPYTNTTYIPHKISGITNVLRVAAFDNYSKRACSPNSLYVEADDTNIYVKDLGANYSYISCDIYVQLWFTKT